jgi:ABC-type transport system involved in cytochrome c biogenesis permease subunit
MTSIENIALLVATASLAGAGAAYLIAFGVELPIKPAPRVAARLARLCLSIALAALTVSLVSRGMQARSWPVGTPHEFTSLLSLFMFAPYIVLPRRTPQLQLGAAISILGLVLLGGVRLTLAPAPDTQTLPPAMQGPWFPLHTLLIALAFGLLGLAASSAVLQLAAPQFQLTAAVDCSMNLGYVALSLGMIAGGIWGEMAWGSYWTWSIKEIWTLATWLASTIYLHVRHRHAWRGSRALWVAALAFALALTTVYVTPSMVRWTRLTGPPIY